MNTPVVLIEHSDGLVIITINRPEQKNAVNRAVSYGVCEAIGEMERNPALPAAGLTGAAGLARARRRTTALRQRAGQASHFFEAALGVMPNQIARDHLFSFRPGHGEQAAVAAKL